MNLWRRGEYRVWLAADFGYGDLLRALLGILCSSMVINMINFNFYHPFTYIQMLVRQSTKHLAVCGKRWLALISIILIIFKYSLLARLLPITPHRAVTLLHGNKPRICI